MSGGADTDHLRASAEAALADDSLPVSREVQQTVTGSECDKKKELLKDIPTIHSQGLGLPSPYDTATRTTPEPSLINQEPYPLQKSVDATAIQRGHSITSVQDLVVATASPKSTSYEMLAFHSEDPRPTDQATVSTMRRRSHGITLLTAVDPENIIDPTKNEIVDSGDENAPTSSLSASKYSFRNRRANYSKLVYDVKYHPMDDDIQPTRAAKRRLAHGEIDSTLVDASGSSSVNSEAGTDHDEAAADETDEEEDLIQSKSRKRRRCQNWPLEPTRRSSRRISEAKVSYDMSVHPQDKELEMIDLASEDGDEDNDASDISSIRERSPGYISAQFVPNLDADTAAPGPDCTAADGGVNAATEMPSHTEAQAIVNETTSSSSTVATPPPRSVRRQEGLDVWMLEPGERYFRHDRESWVLPFNIHTEHLEDQLAADANAASPYAFDHDDKENDEADSAVEQASNIGTMSIMPALQYRRTSEDRHASCERSMVDGALYDFNHSRSPYGLGGNDGTHESHEPGLGSTFVNDCLRVLISGEQLPRGSDS